ncbi:MAG: hypothetical protein VZQ51_10435 [Bacteroidales bacterium]|nr:hypothetical protein [Bacteroidales bacterium]
MKHIRVKDIFSEAWELFKSYWWQLTGMAFAGYLLPIILFVKGSAYTLTNSESGLDDCAVCALMVMVILFIGGIILVFGLAFIKPLIRSFCYNKIIKAEKQSVLKIFFNNCIPGILFSKEFVFFSGCIVVLILVIFGGSLIGKTVFAVCGIIFFLLIIACFVISVNFMFAPYILTDNPHKKVSESARLSQKLVSDNHETVIITLLICFGIDIVLWCTVIGVAVAVPFKILVTAVLYKNVSQNAREKIRTALQSPPPHNITRLYN